MGNNNYVTRRDVIRRACDDMITEMYHRAQPSVNIKSYEEMYRLGVLDKDTDRCYEWHYLPEAVQRQIVDDYLDAYNLRDQFRLQLEKLLDLFRNGGHRTVFKDIFGTGENVRTGEETEHLDELIGEDNAKTVYSLIDEFLMFYRTNMEEMQLRSAIFSCPTSNPNTVRERWGDKFIIDESVYKNQDDEYDYHYKDYIDGRITGEMYLEDQEYSDNCDCCVE